MTFLSIVTRHMTSRPNLYVRHCASLETQTCQDFEHILILDSVGRGLAWANAQFAVHRNEAAGEYVLMLDDDDELLTPDAVATLKQAVADSAADLVIFRGEHGRHGILPDVESWQRGPVYAHIGGQDFITRREVWRRHIHAFAVPIAGDYAFLSALWPCGYMVQWLDRLLVRQQRNSDGRPE